MLKRTKNLTSSRIPDSLAGKPLEDSKINVSDITTFLPWACEQFNVDVILDITKNVPVEYQKLVSARKQKPRNAYAIPKAMLSEYDYDQQQDNTTFKSSYTYNLVYESRTVHIIATYKGDFLQHLKIHKSKCIPREVLRILGLAIKCYPQLYGITINGGIDKYTVYEISKFLPMSNITEITLDNSYCKEGNHHLVLNNCRNLTMLSLARCKLGDEAAKKIVLKLESSQPASLTLTILNLASNQLSDKTAQHLAQVLRTNRKLSYLNLAGNMITDEGAGAILKVLYTFPLTKEEKLQAKRKYTNYLKNKNTLVEKIITKLQPVDVEFYAMKKKRQSRLHAVESKSDVRGHKQHTVESESALEAYYRERAEEMAAEQVREDPFVTDLFQKDGWVFSNGNNVLAYLNIAYNNVSYITVKLLLLVLNHQRDILRKPRGLVNVCIEGNALPKCEELAMIDSLLDVGFRDKRIPSLTKRRSYSKLTIENKVTVRQFD